MRKKSAKCLVVHILLIHWSAKACAIALLQKVSDFTNGSNGSLPLLLKITRKGAKQGQVYHFLFIQANSKQLQHAADILSTRNYHPSLDGVYKLEDAEKAFEHIASEHSQGKTIIEI